MPCSQDVAKGPAASLGSRYHTNNEVYSQSAPGLKAMALTKSKAGRLTGTSWALATCQATWFGTSSRTRQLDRDQHALPAKTKKGLASARIGPQISTSGSGYLGPLGPATKCLLALVHSSLLLLMRVTMHTSLACGLWEQHQVPCIVCRFRAASPTMCC